MLDDIRDLILSNDICVLATVSENKPHCSLMAYIAGQGGLTLYMLSSRSTKKYNNILRNTNVSLLIDTREKNPGDDRAHAKALTLSGTCAPMPEGALKDEMRDTLLRHHPHLSKLAGHPDADILEMEVESALLLNGVKESYFERLR